MDPERLMEGKFIHIGQQVSDSEGEGDEWQSHIGEMFPIGSEIRSALIRVLEKHVASDTISNMLKGRKLKVTPFSAKLKEGLRFEGVRGRNYPDNLTFSDKNSTEVQKRKLRYLSEFDYDLIWKAGEENIVPDALSRIFGNIAKRVESEKGIEIEERISVQEPEARVMNQENASTNVDLSDNTPQWLIDCKRR